MAKQSLQSLSPAVGTLLVIAYPSGTHPPLQVKLEANSMAMDYSEHALHPVSSSSYNMGPNDSEFLDVAAQVIAGSGPVVDPTAYAAPVSSSANGWYNPNPHTISAAAGTMLGVSTCLLSPAELTSLPHFPRYPRVLALLLFTQQRILAP